MKTKLFLLLSITFFLPLFIFSQSVTEKQAETVAKNFFYEKINIHKTVSYEDVKLRLKQNYIKKKQNYFQSF